MLNYLFLIIILLSIFSLKQILTGKSIWDRLLGLNLFSSKIILLILMYSLISGYTFLIDIAIVYSLLGFLGTVFIARFIQRKGSI
jgi:multicomponent Na+:H+ antiporter subunit F